MSSFNIHWYENHLPETWEEIEPIEQSSINRKHIDIKVHEVFESPLVNAWSTLWDKWITTIMSGANCKEWLDVHESTAYISLDYYKLNQGNIKVINELVNEGVCEVNEQIGALSIRNKWAYIKFIIWNQTPTEVSERMDKIAHRFHTQKIKIIADSLEKPSGRVFNIMKEENI